MSCGRVGPRAALWASRGVAALALGYFLTLSIWLAFDAVFHSELDEVTETALAGVEESLQLDEQIRLSRVDAGLVGVVLEVDV